MIVLLKSRISIDFPTNCHCVSIVFPKDSSKTVIFRHFRPFPYRKFKGNFFQKTKKMTKKEGPGECPCASLISVCEGHLFGPSEIFSNCHRPRASKMPINSSRGHWSDFGRTPDGRRTDMLSIGVRTDVIGASRNYTFFKFLNKKLRLNF